MRRLMRRLEARNEVGATTVEFAMEVIIVVTIFMVMFGYAIRFHSHQVVAAAAEDALAVAQRYGSDPAQAQAAAKNDVNHLGGGLSNVTVSVSYTGNTATVTVSGDGPSFVPLIPMHVSAQVTAPIEQFVQPSGAGQ